jgi:hypothetical protein
MSLAPAVDAHEETSKGSPPGFATVTEDTALASKKYKVELIPPDLAKSMFCAANILWCKVLNYWIDH